MKLRLFAIAAIAGGILASGAGTASAQSCPQVRPPGINTQVGTQLRIDHWGNRDKCVVFNTTVAVDPRCPSGRFLQRRGGRDRCVRRTASISCPSASGIPGISGSVGTLLRVDLQGNRDKCVVPNTSIRLNPACPIGYGLRRRGGRDFCRT
ncbi:hypothetical protein LNKW23_31150 [Paralimibaculum aggregatum]|uniref:Secreted protein n=1 Tax=Paralimibaculum aggregatum TaxID=3036245 RepID=A0ABQ6LRL1_9RHOB|nr:hypothetical protein [Limibaculum sp. NKW23]GMG83901.1 hypothetical protein LNKW23_31150 [Limibaculum sp. NKW23]